MVIWRSGTSVSLYRGIDYDDGMKPSVKGSPSSSLRPAEKVDSAQNSNGAFISNTGKEEIVEQAPEIKYEDEIDKLLDELGPRYSDWPGSDPLPVDADLLPATIPGYKPPFRVLPYGVRPSLSRRDMTNLRRLARGLPPHFALGKSYVALVKFELLLINYAILFLIFHLLMDVRAKQTTPRLSQCYGQAVGEKFNC